MKIAQLAYFTALIAGANLVAGAVVAFLGVGLPRDDTFAEVGGWIIIMAVALWCAICFLEGAVAQGRRLFIRRNR